MTNSITCPNCKTDIVINEVMRSQLTVKIRSELEADVTAKRAELDAAQKLIDEQRVAVEAAQHTVEIQIRRGIENERSALVVAASKKAREDLAIEINDQLQQLNELQGKLKEAQSNELALRKRERDLQSQKERLQLEVAREIDAEREKIRTESKLQFEEQRQFKDAEKEKQITDLRKQIDELKRKAEQGSQQMQGEVQELALEDLLVASFPMDAIEPIAKGVRGGDAIQNVLDAAGLRCGGILWESKRTKNWQAAWLSKARDDQRAARAGCVVIVTEALPEGIRNFGLIDGVWVCSWSCIIGVASALRAGLIEVSKSKLALQCQHEKMEIVYAYLAGHEFQQRIEGVVEAFITMQSDLDTERRAMQRIWSKREKQLERALSNIAGLYGDLQGIIGSSMPSIEGLEMPRIQCEAPIALEIPLV